MFEREVTEVRSNKQVEISEIDGRLQEQYQARLQSALQELREHYESQMKQNREEVENLYQNKVLGSPSVVVLDFRSVTDISNLVLDSRSGGPYSQSAQRS